jgi:hypothetical protein
MAQGFKLASGKAKCEMRNATRAVMLAAQRVSHFAFRILEARSRHSKRIPS